MMNSRELGIGRDVLHGDPSIVFPMLAIVMEFCNFKWEKNRLFLRLLVLTLLGTPDKLYSFEKQESAREYRWN